MASSWSLASAASLLASPWKPSDVRAATTTSAGRTRSAVSATLAAGVSAPRKMILQPWSRNAKAEHDERQIVLLAGRARQQGDAAADAFPSSRQGKEPATDQVAGEVLLRDRHGALLPAAAQVPKVRQNHPGQHGLDHEGREGLIDRGMRVLGVHGVKCGREPLARDMHRALGAAPAGLRFQRAPLAPPRRRICRARALPASPARDARRQASTGAGPHRGRPRAGLGWSGCA